MNRLSIILVLAVLVAMPAPTNAQNCGGSITSNSTAGEFAQCLFEIGNIANSAKAEAERLTVRVERLTNLNRELQNQNRVLAAQTRDINRQLLPRNAVIIVDSPEGCPAGWRVLDATKSRFVIGASLPNTAPIVTGRGASLNRRLHLQTGGAETHPLRKHHHKHHHLVTVKEGQFDKSDRLVAGSGGGPPGVFEIEGKDPVITNEDATYAGEGEGRETLPPFVALFFCELR